MFFPRCLTALDVVDCRPPLQLFVRAGVAGVAVASPRGGDRANKLGAMGFQEQG